MANPFGMSLEDLRKQYPAYDNKGYTDAEIVMDLAQRTGMDLRSAAGAVGYDVPESDMGLSASMGATGFKSSMAHAGQGLLGMDNREYIREQQMQEQLLGGLAQQDPTSNPLTWEETQFWDENKGIQDYASQLLFGSLPHMAGPIAGGIGGGLVGGVPGAMAGAFTGGLPSASGEVLSSQYDQAGRYDIESAMPLIAGHSALNLLGPEGLIAGRFASALPRFAGSRIGSGLTYAGIGAGSEAFAEGEQTRLEQMARMGVDPTYDINSPEAQAERTEARIGGGLLGGLLSGPVGLTNPIVNNGQGPQPDATTDDTTTTPPSPGTGSNLMTGEQMDMFDGTTPESNFQGDMFDTGATPAPPRAEIVPPAVNPNQMDMFLTQQEMELVSNPNITPQQRQAIQQSLVEVQQKANMTAKKIFRGKPAQLRALQTLRDNPELAAQMGDIETMRQAKLDYQAQRKAVIDRNKGKAKKDREPMPVRPDFKTQSVAAKQIGALLGITESAASKNISKAYETLAAAANEVGISPEMLLRRLRLEPRQVAPETVTSAEELTGTGAGVETAFAEAMDENVGEVTIGREDLALGEDGASTVGQYSIGKSAGDTKAFKRTTFNQQDFGTGEKGTERAAAARKAAKLDEKADAFLKKNDKLRQVKSTKEVGKQWNQLVKKVFDATSKEKTLRWAQLPPEAQKAFADEIQSSKGQISKKRARELGAEARKLTPVGKPETTTAPNKAAQQAENDAQEAQRLFRKHFGRDIDVETSSPTSEALSAIDAVTQARKLGKADQLEDADTFRQVVRYMQSVYKRSGGSGVSDKKLKTWLKRPMSKLGSWVEIEIKQSVKDVPLPEGQRSHPADMAGAVVNGKIYLVADNIGTRAEAIETLAHEVVGHVGMEQMLGTDKFEDLLNNIRELKRRKDKTIMRVMRDIESNYRDLNGKYSLDERTEAREIIAHLAEENPSFGVFRQVAAAIRLWFAKHGFGDLQAATLNKILADATTIVTHELESAAVKIATEDAYARTGDMRKAMYDERYDQVMDAYDNPEYVQERVNDLKQTAVAYGARLRQSGDEYLRRVGQFIGEADPTVEGDGPLLAFRDYLLSGNRTGLTDRNVIPVSRRDLDNGTEMSYIVTDTVGPFENGVFVKFTFQNDVVSRHSNRKDSVVTSAVPMEHASELQKKGVSDDARWSFLSTLLYPHSDLLDNKQHLQMINDKRDTPMTTEQLRNTLDVSAFGPLLGMDLAAQYFPEADGMDITGGNLPSNEFFSTHIDADNLPYIRFDGVGRLRSKQFTAMMNRFHYAMANEDGLSQPNFFSYRQTGTNPFSFETGEGKLPMFRTNQQSQAVYKRNSNYSAPESAFDTVKKELRYAYRSLADKAPALLSLHALFDVYGSKLSKLKDYYNTVSAMENMQQKMQNDGHKVAMKWDGLKSDVKAKLDSLMMDSTMSQIHPDKAFNHKWNEHLKPAEEAAYNELAARYNALPEEAQEVYQLARKRLSDDWKVRQQVYRDLVRHAFDPQIEAATDPAEKKKLTAERDKYIDENARRISSIKGPYFPLSRFGSHVVVYKSEAYKAMEEKVETAAGKEGKEAREEFEAMRKNKDHYWVRAFDSARDAMKIADTAEGTTYQYAFAFENAGNRDITQTGIQRVATALEAEMTRKNLPKNAINAVKGMLAELYVSSLPENSAVKSELERKNITGAEEDMLRSYASNIERNAFHLSRLKYNTEVTEHLYDLKIQSKDYTATEQQVAAEVMKRHALDMEYFNQPYQNFVAKLSGIYHLLSPSYWMVNATQPWFIGAPYLAARFGMGRSLSALRGGFADGANMVKNMIRENGRFADLDVSSIKDANEREMLQFLIDKGRIDINITHDLGVLARGDTDKVSKLSRLTMWPAHQVETVNRVMVALAAYRMAKQGGKIKAMDHKAATEFADKAVIDTQIDYSNVNAPRFMKHGAMPLGKLVWQFRKYQHAMVQLIVLNARSFKSDPQARATLGYMLGTQLTTAGLVGLPMANVAGMIFDLFIDNDDEEGDARTQMYNALVDNVGKEMADLVVKGVPAALIGTDITKRTGMGDLFSLMPFLRTDGYTGQDMVGNILVSAGGAPMAMMTAAFDAGKFANDGQWMRAIESIMPKMVKDVFKAYRYEQEGIASRGGVIGIGDDSFSPWDITQRALGLTPMQEADYWEAKTALRETSEAIQKRKNRLRREFAEARANSDQAEMAAVRKAVREFNREHPKYRIKGSDLYRAYKDRRKPKEDEMNLGREAKKLADLTRFAE